jgi:hypothetical protein
MSTRGNGEAPSKQQGVVAASDTRLRGLQSAATAVVQQHSVEPSDDLQNERSRASFDAAELAVFLAGGADKMQTKWVRRLYSIEATSLSLILSISVGYCDVLIFNEPPFVSAETQHFPHFPKPRCYSYTINPFGITYGLRCYLSRSLPFAASTDRDRLLALAKGFPGGEKASRANLTREEEHVAALQGAFNIWCALLNSQSTLHTCPL